MHGARPTVLQGSDADGGDPIRPGLAIVGQLYGIERAASNKQMDAPARQRLRREEARTILEKLRAYLQEQQAGRYRGARSAQPSATRYAIGLP